MKFISLDNSYALLGLSLSPRTDEEHLSILEEAIIPKRVSWEALLYQANINYCTPLWYVRLRQKNLLPLLPPELREYLRLLHQANAERNLAFRQALRELLIELQEREIPSILLKGAATFCDDLYGDDGARMLGDLDILVGPKHLAVVREVLKNLGYREVSPDDKEDGPVFTPAYRSHHLPRLNKSGTPVDVEIHFGVSRGQKGNILPAELAWQHREEVVFDGIPVSMLDPTRRLLHNTVHALVSDRRFIRSHVSLRDLAEFAAIVNQAGSDIAWNEWFGRGAFNGLGGEFNVYLVLGFGLAGLTFPQGFSESFSTRVKVARILAAAKHAGGPEDLMSTTGNGLKRQGVRIWVKASYHARLPFWLWRDPCYAQGVRKMPMRMRCMAAIYRRMFRVKFSDRQ
jgi:hypothetical protein